MVNSRPILCLGKANGEISIYYVDEPIGGRKENTTEVHGKATYKTVKKAKQESFSKEGTKVRKLLPAHFNFFQPIGVLSSGASALNESIHTT